MSTNTAGGQYHIPVLLNEAVDALNVKKDGIYADGTMGGGGHSEEILKRGGRLIAIDRDQEAIGFVQERFSKIPEYKDRYHIIHDNFKNIKAILQHAGIQKLDGAILDLGISSRQVDDKKRGFSYMGDAEIDMRMDKTQKTTAFDIVNRYGEEDLRKVLYDYGEEKNAFRIVKEILKARSVKPIETTGELAKIVVSCFPPFVKGGHPAKRTFQALRIEVNEELEGLGEALNDFIDVLNPGARLSVITFHSIEDRIVKRTFKELSQDCICEKSLPVCVCNHKASVKPVFSKGQRPSMPEQEQNPRSKSATLRAVQKE